MIREVAVWALSIGLYHYPMDAIALAGALLVALGFMLPFVALAVLAMAFGADSRRKIGDDRGPDRDRPYRQLP